jgi:hypothetical protein
MTLRKDKGALRKHYSAMNAADKGPVTGSPAPERGDPTKVGPQPPSIVPDNSQFLEQNFGGVPSTPKGASLAQKGQRVSVDKIETPVLAGHHFMDNPARGNSPRRSATQQVSESLRRGSKVLNMPKKGK